MGNVFATFFEFRNGGKKARDSSLAIQTGAITLAEGGRERERGRRREEGASHSARSECERRLLKLNQPSPLPPNAGRADSCLERLRDMSTVHSRSPSFAPKALPVSEIRDCA